MDLGNLSVYLMNPELTPLQLPGGDRSAALAFGRYYTSENVATGPLGASWTHNYNILLTTAGSSVTIRDWNATERVFTLDGGVYNSGANVNGESKLYKDANNNFVWQLRHGTKYTFDATHANRLATVADRQGNTVTLNYDGNSFLTSVTDSAGRSVNFVNDGSGRVTQMTDPLNRTSTYTYDPLGQLTNVTDGLGFKGAYAYQTGNVGRVQIITHASGHANAYAYDAVGKAIAATNALGQVEYYKRNDAEHWVVVTNWNGNAYTNYNNERGFVTNQVDAAGISWFFRDDADRVTNHVNRLGFTNRYSYNPGSCACQISGELLMSIDPLGRMNQWGYETNFHFPTAFTNAAGGVTRWTYDNRGNLTYETNALIQVTAHQYDAAGNHTQTADELTRIYQFAYDQYGNLTNTVDPMNHTSRFRYDILGRLTHRTDALGNTKAYVYDARDRRTQSVDALGRTNTAAYDGDGNLTGQTNALGYATTYTYDDVDQLSSMTLPGSSTPFISYGYDGQGNRVGMTNALGKARRFGYDAMDRQTSATNELGYFWTFAYDAEGRMTRELDALGHTNQFEYDRVGRLVAQTNALGNGTEFAYNLLDQRIAITNALGKVWSFRYDALGRMTNSADPNTHKNWFTYDAVGQLTATTNALNQVVQFQYDLAGNRTNIVDARGNPLGFGYDPVNRLTNITYAASDAERFQYDPAGNLTNYTSRAGERIQFIYDAANRLTNKTYTGGSDVLTFLYDAADRLTNGLWKVGSTTNSLVTFQFDTAGRLTNESQKVSTAAAHSVAYEYDAAGRKTKLTYPDGTFVTYAYNANGALTNISDGGTNAIVSYQYDPAGRCTNRALENSTFTVYDYDAANQMTNIVHKKNDGNVISSYAYGYDDAGQRTWVKRANGYGDVYKYDATDQLTNVLYEATNPDTSPSAWTNEARYAFDAAGNRTSVNVTNSGTTGYTADALNQYTDVGGAAPGYDDNGNMSYDVAGWVYTYDRENRLKSAEDSVDSDPTVAYRYDAFNRLIERNNIGQSATRFYYDNEWRVIAEYDESDNLKAKYVYGPEIDEPVRMTRSGTNYYYHAAALGTVTEITSTNGTLWEHYAYDVYGTPKMWDGGGSVIANSQIGNRLLFQGRDRDPNTGLYNFRNRYYSPGLGRFVQVDPVREQAGLNLYGFVGNSPIRDTDAMGFGINDPPSCAPYPDCLKWYRPPPRPQPPSSPTHGFCHYINPPHCPFYRIYFWASCANFRTQGFSSWWDCVTAISVCNQH